MNNNTEVVFENIEARILNFFKNAHYSIFVSVALFTNDYLFSFVTLFFETKNKRR